MPTVTTTPARETIDPLAVMGRILASPRGDATAARRRLDLLGRMLRIGGGWWRAEDLSRADDDDLAETRDRLHELRRHGAITWDERAQAYTITDGIRVPLALVMLAADEGLDAHEAEALRALLPFAGVAERADARQAPAWAILDLLERDAREMENVLHEGREAVLRSAHERRLGAHASTMTELVAHLVELDGDDALPDALVQRAVALLERTAGLLARLSTRMSRASRDGVRLRDSRLSPRRARQAVTTASDGDLAECLHDALGLPAIPVTLVCETALAAAAPVAGEGRAARTFPSASSLATPDPAPGPPEHDGRQRAKAILDACEPGRVGNTIFSSDVCWSDAIAIQQGLARVQSEAAREGVVTWTPSAEHVYPGGEISWANDINLSAA